MPLLRRLYAVGRWPLSLLVTLIAPPFATLRPLSSSNHPEGRARYAGELRPRRSTSCRRAGRTSPSSRPYISNDCEFHFVITPPTRSDRPRPKPWIAEPPKRLPLSTASGTPPGHRRLRERWRQNQVERPNATCSRTRTSVIRGSASPLVRAHGARMAPSHRSSPRNSTRYKDHHGWDLARHSAPSCTIFRTTRHLRDHDLQTR